MTARERLHQNDSLTISPQIVALGLFGFSRELPLHLQPKLANWDNPIVRAGVAERQNLLPHLQEQLVLDNNSVVRAAMAYRSDLDPKLQPLLVEDEALLVRVALAYNPRCLDIIAERLKLDPHPNVRHALRKKTILPVRNHKTFYFPNNVMTINLSDDLTRFHMVLAKFPDVDIRLAIAGLEQLRPEAQASLCFDEAPEVRRVVVHRNDFRESMAAKMLQDSDPEVRRTIALRNEYELYMRDNQSTPTQIS